MSRKKAERIEKAMLEVQDALSDIKQILSSEDAEDSEAYNKGLEDAWKSTIKMHDMTLEELKLIFGEDGYTWTKSEFIEVIIKRHTPQEVLMKLEAYKKEQEIKVGDVVEGIEADVMGVVVGKIFKDTAYILFRDGSAGLQELKDFKKTGKHIDISSILEQIKES